MARLSACVLLILVLTPTAGATTLQVNGGGFSSSSFGFWDLCGAISGNGFKIPSLAGVACWPAAGGVNHNGHTSTTISSGFVFLNSTGYQPPPPVFACPNPFPNLRFEFVYEPFSETMLLVPGQNPIIEPFTMIGTLTLLDPVTGDPVVFDLVGQGMLNVYWRDEHYPGGEASFPHLNVSFSFASVPEPSSLLLLVLGVGLMLTRSRRYNSLARYRS